MKSGDCLTTSASAGPLLTRIIQSTTIISAYFYVVNAPANSRSRDGRPDERHAIDFRFPRRQRGGFVSLPHDSASFRAADVARVDGGGATPRRESTPVGEPLQRFSLGDT